MSAFLPEDNVAIELTFQKLFKKLWPFLARHKAKILLSVSLVFLFAGVGRALPIIFGMAVDEGIREQHQDRLAMFAIAYFVFEFFRAVLAFAQTSFIQKFGNQVLFEIREALVAHVQRLPISYFDKNPSGRIMTRVTNDVFALGELFSQGFAAIFISLVEISAILLSLLMLSLKLTALTILILPILIWGCWLISRKIRFQFGAAKRKLSTINAYAAEAVSGMKVLQLFHRQEQAREIFNRISEEYRYLQLRTVNLFAMLWPLIEAFNLISLASSLLLAAYFHDEIGLSVGQMSAFILLLQGFFKPFKVILERYNQLQNSLASADRVFQMLSEKQEVLSGTKQIADPEGHIEFRNVEFRYSENGPIVLNDVHLDIKPGTSVALVGRTGSGKSTMIALLQKMYNVTSGEILLDGVNIQNIGAQDLRTLIGVVQQDNFIFSGTLLYNITLGDKRITLERAAWAAERAQCLSLIEKLGGFNGLVQERGANLSVGERQLIAFARALAYDPKILILDEATANIDSMNEERIQGALRNVIKGRTSLIIAHRISTIIDCDQILLLDKGKILQKGSHVQLFNQPGPYREMCLSHFGHATAAAPLS